MHNVGDLPGEVHCVTDAGIHALTTDRTVDVRRIAEQEHTPDAELIGHSMVDAVRRKPIDPLYVDTAIRRWQAYTGEAAYHAVTGRRFDETASTLGGTNA